MFPRFLALACSESEDNIHTTGHSIVQIWQVLQMRNFLRDVDPSLLYKKEYWHPNNDVFQWLSSMPSDSYQNMPLGLALESQEGFVTTIVVAHKSYQQPSFYYMWTPSTVEVLRIVSSKQKYTLDSSLFPGNSLVVSFHANLIYGSIDLSRLPVHLEELILSDNEITGPIDFTNLPTSLRELDLRSNKIKQDVVYYASLPSKCRCIRLGMNRIDAAKALFQDNAVMNRNIFDWH